MCYMAHLDINQRENTEWGFADGVVHGDIVQGRRGRIHASQQLPPPPVASGKVRASAISCGCVRARGDLSDLQARRCNTLFLSGLFLNFFHTSE